MALGMHRNASTNETTTHVEVRSLARVERLLDVTSSGWTGTVWRVMGQALGGVGVSVSGAAKLSGVASKVESCEIRTSPGRAGEATGALLGTNTDVVFSHAKVMIQAVSGMEAAVMKRSAQDGIDAIVIGSGIGGLACACALTHSGMKVEVLEQHFVAGGLTQTFSRKGFTWDVGVHYLGEMHEGGAARGVLDWLCEGAIGFSPAGPVYDTIHFPNGAQYQFARPREALERELYERFPASRAQIGTYFQAVEAASKAGRAVFAQRAMPALLGKVYGFMHTADIHRWWGRTTADVLHELIEDPQLRAVLAAQRGDYGPDPSVSSFGIHATVARHYFDGARYPANGAKAFADALVPIIERAGGKVRTRARASEILIADGKVAGVRLKDGQELRCPLVFSDAGAKKTVQLLPAELRDSTWGREIDSFRPSACHVQLYLGLEGDIQARGGTSSNHWFYETLDLASGLWRGPLAQPVIPAMFVSFPTLKNDGAAGGLKHTADVVVFTDWDIFRPWEGSLIGQRPAEYASFKHQIEEHLLAHFVRHFPALEPLIVYRELSTPLSTVAFTGAEHGAVYGLEASPRRFLSSSLRAKTPVPGLYLAGQDVTSMGVTGAMMGGVLGAAALEPGVFRHLP
jgi:all-trans-retinol 13,14-reductase